jgi:tetratricopeptide (TPR) repeat protein
LGRALAWTSELDHPYTAAFSQMLASTTHNSWYLRDLKASMTHGQQALQLAQEGGFAYILALSTFYLGHATVVACVQQGDDARQEVAEGFALMRQGLEMESAVGSKLGLTNRWLSLADAHRQCGQIDQAWQALQQAEVEAYGRQELYFEAEILRVKGALCLLAGDTYLATACLRQAIRSARRQEAKFWELRATMALGRLWQQQGKPAQARRLLTKVIRWFDGECAAPDVLEARALL